MFDLTTALILLERANTSLALRRKEALFRAHFRCCLTPKSTKVLLRKYHAVSSAGKQLERLVDILLRVTDSIAHSKPLLTCVKISRNQELDRVNEVSSNGPTLTQIFETIKDLAYDLYNRSLEVLDTKCEADS
jgi:hypothetical protein